MPTLRLGPAASAPSWSSCSACSAVNQGIIPTHPPASDFCAFVCVKGVVLCTHSFDVGLTVLSDECVDCALQFSKGVIGGGFDTTSGTPFATIGEKTIYCIHGVCNLSFGPRFFVAAKIVLLGMHFCPKITSLHSVTGMQAWQVASHVLLGSGMRQLGIWILTWSLLHGSRELQRYVGRNTYAQGYPHCIHWPVCVLGEVLVRRLWLCLRRSLYKVGALTFG